MRTDLSQIFLDELSRQGVAPVQLAVFKFASGDRYLSDRELEYSPGLFAEPLIENWGTLNRTASPSETLAGAGVPISVCTLSILNIGPDWFSAQFNTESPEGTEVELWQYLKGIDDFYLIDTFIIQDNIQHSQGSLVVTVDLVSSLLKTDRKIGYLDSLTKEYLPYTIGGQYDVSGALSGDHPVTFLLAGVTAASTTLVTKTSDLISLGYPSSGQIILDFELISYTSISGGSFLGCTRGVSAGDDYSAAFPHAEDAVITLYGHEYIYDFAPGPQETVSSDVYVNGVLYDGEFTVYKDGPIVQVGFMHTLPHVHDTENGQVVDVPDRAMILAQNGIQVHVLNVNGDIEYVDPYTFDNGEIYDDTNPFIEWTYAYIKDSGYLYIGSVELVYESPTGYANFATGLTASSGTIYGAISGDTTPSTEEQITVNETNGEWTYSDVIDYMGWVEFSVSGPSIIDLSEYISPVDCSYNGPDRHSFNQYFAARLDYCSPLTGGTATTHIKDISYAPVISIGDGSSINPAIVMEAAIGLLGLSSLIDSSSFSYAEIWFDNNGYSFNGVIPGTTQISAALSEMCKQSRSIVYQDRGKLFLKIKQPLDSQSPVMSFYSETNDDVAKNSISVSSQRSEDTKNWFDVRYNAADVQAGYQGSFTLKDQTSITKHGVQQDTLDLYLVADQAMAQDIAAFWLDERKQPYTIITFKGYTEAFPLEIGDVVALVTRYSGLVYFKGKIVNPARQFGSWKQKQLDHHQLMIAGYPINIEEEGIPLKRNPTLVESSFSLLDKKLPTVLRKSSLAVIDGYIYMFGGQTTVDTDAIYRASVTDPTTWEIVEGVLPVPLRESSILVTGGYIYLFGGYSSAVTDAIFRAPITDPTNWTTLVGTLPEPVYGSKLVVVGDYIYMLGGYTTEVTDAIYRASVSDPESWEKTTSTLPTPLHQSSVCVANGTIYLFGGLTSTSTTSAIYTASVSDPTAWTTSTANLPVELRITEMLLIGDFIYLFGGLSTSSLDSIFRAHVSDPLSWITLSHTLPIALQYAKSFIVAGQVYIAGGFSGSGLDDIICGTIISGFEPDATIHNFGGAEVYEPWRYKTNTVDGDLLYVG